MVNFQPALTNVEHFFEPEQTLPADNLTYPLERPSPDSNQFTLRDIPDNFRINDVNLPVNVLLKIFDKVAPSVPMAAPSNGGRFALGGLGDLSRLSAVNKLFHTLICSSTNAHPAGASSAPDRTNSSRMRAEIDKHVGMRIYNLALDSADTLKNPNSMHYFMFKISLIRSSAFLFGDQIARPLRSLAYEIGDTLMARPQLIRDTNGLGAMNLEFRRMAEQAQEKQDHTTLKALEPCFTILSKALSRGYAEQSPQRIPSQTFLSLNSAHLALMANQVETAQSTLESVLQQGPAIDTPFSWLLGRSFLQLAIKQNNNKDLTAAKASLQRVLDLNPVRLENTNASTWVQGGAGMVPAIRSGLELVQQTLETLESGQMHPITAKSLRSIFEQDITFSEFLDFKLSKEPLEFPQTPTEMRALIIQNPTVAKSHIQELRRNGDLSGASNVCLGSAVGVKRKLNHMMLAGTPPYGQAPCLERMKLIKAIEMSSSSPS